ncbi:hypothetical protein [Amycolatopsis pithecellobii]|uniref:Uncharacterized protein n=1 Tax=Amycolatopsis pithecellobii TaxID=664692 RepID=A0A6N7YYP5_9PSEU|nr:hypothetical protein [Amycolatopsis pithecellobii]MTD57018.1 hypothetical protein [Amycolatopsis pithecellobii]
MKSRKSSRRFAAWSMLGAALIAASLAFASVPAAAGQLSFGGFPGGIPAATR